MRYTSEYIPKLQLHQHVAALVPPQGGNQENLVKGGNPPISNIFGLDHEVNVYMRASSYGTPLSFSDP